MEMFEHIQIIIFLLLEHQHLLFQSGLKKFETYHIHNAYGGLDNQIVVNLHEHGFIQLHHDDQYLHDD